MCCNVGGRYCIARTSVPSNRRCCDDSRRSMYRGSCHRLFMLTKQVTDSVQRLHLTVSEQCRSGRQLITQETIQASWFKSNFQAGRYLPWYHEYWRRLHCSKIGGRLRSDAGVRANDDPDPRAEHLHNPTLTINHYFSR